jgi:hypothetical protein
MCKSFLSAVTAAAAPGRSVGVTIAVLMTATLAGCTAYDVSMRERQHAADEQACTSAGHKPGTNDFAKCLQDRDLMRTRATFGDSVSPPH